jgi:beta-galactosidase
MRFQADAVRDAMRAQRDILKSANPSWKITTNNPGCTGALRFDEIYGMMDFAAVDAYITMGTVQRARWSWSMFRGLTGRQQPFMTAETGCFSSSSDKASSYDAIRAWFWDAKLHGCGDYVFFRWRESVNGEEDHPAILPWSGKPGVGYATVKRIKAEFDAVALDLAMPASHMAIVHDAATDQFMRARGTEWSDVLYSTEQRLHAAAGRYGVIPDMVQLSDGMDISPYRLVFLPCCETLTEVQRKKLAAFVEAGGTLVSFPRLSCTRPDGGSYVAEPYPVGLRSLFGIEVNERRLLKRQKGGDYYTGDLSPVPLDYPGGGAFAGYAFVERVEPSDAETIAALSATCFAGSPLATRCRRGKGEAWYFAVFPDAEGAKTIVRDFLVRLGVDVSTEWPATVTAAKRGGRTVVVNCSEAAVETPVGPLGPFEVKFL